MMARGGRRCRARRRMPGRRHSGRPVTSRPAPSLSAPRGSGTGRGRARGRAPRARRSVGRRRGNRARPGPAVPPGPRPATAARRPASGASVSCARWPRLTRNPRRWWISVSRSRLRTCRMRGPAYASRTVRSKRSRLKPTTRSAARSRSASAPASRSYQVVNRRSSRRASPRARAPCRGSGPSRRPRRRRAASRGRRRASGRPRTQQVRGQREAGGPFRGGEDRRGRPLRRPEITDGAGAVGLVGPVRRPTPTGVLIRGFLGALASGEPAKKSSGSAPPRARRRGPWCDASPAPRRPPVRQRDGPRHDLARRHAEHDQRAQLVERAVPEPHLGEWTQAGQPSSHGHAAISARVRANSSSARAKPVRARPTPPGQPS